MDAISLVPLQTAAAEAYWRVYVAGRTDLPSRDLQAHLDRYLALPPEEQRTHLAIMKDGTIIGTLRLLPDTITGFAIEPARQQYATLALVKAMDLLRSQGVTAITASYEDRYEPFFEALGFRRRFARMRMEAPTKRFPPASGVGLKPPEESEVVHLAAFFKDVYEGHLEQQYGMHVGTDDEWRAYMTGVLKGEVGRFMPEASLVAVDAGRIVGAILMSHWMGMPLIAEVGVAKDRRGKGLGRALLEAASSRLESLGEPVWALYVTLGNDNAIALYKDFEFIQAGGQTVTARLEGS
ncbi:MAG: GNAT family N-acetyltransferase [Candidatus Thermoplasmatota archaeon]